jgi:hypothetical protein
VRQPTHLAYGYGEREFRCGSCGESFVVCYPIPPKSSGFLPEPNPKMLKVTFKEGVSGYANPVVLTAKAPAAAKSGEVEGKGEMSEGGTE